MIFSYRQADTFVHRVNPLLKLVALFGLAFCPWYVSLPVMLVLAVAVRLPVKGYLKHSVFFLLLGVLIWISNGWQSTLGFVSLILSGMILTDSTDPEDLAESLRPVLGRNFSMCISITLSMLPVVFETTTQTRLARKARGERFIGKGYLSSVFSILLDKADEYALAFESRS